MIFIGLIIFGLTSFLNVGYSVQITIGLFFCTLVISTKIKKRFGWFPAFSFIYFCLSAISRIAAPLFFWPNVPLEMISTLESITSQTLLYFILVVLIFSKRDKFIGPAFAILGLLNTVVMLWEFFNGRIPCFLLNNPAMDAGFIACVIPVLLNKMDERKFYWNIPLIGLPLLALFISESSTGVLGACLAVGCFLISKDNFSLTSTLLSACFGGIFSIVGFFIQKNVLFNSDGRSGIWKQTMAFWMNKGLSWDELYSKGPLACILMLFNDTYHYIGAGMGTFFLWGPSLQITESLRLDPTHPNKHFMAWFWLHNDWLQILFETGILGFMIALTVFAVAVYKARSAPAVFASLITYGAVAVIQMPLRHFIFAGFGVFLLSVAFRTSEE